MGTPSFALPILESLINEYNVVLVVCQPDKEMDRKGNIILPDTKKMAIEHNIEVFQPNKIKEDYQKILDHHPDLIITCAYGQIIPNEILNYPKYGCINVHGSLLPKLRGGAPIHWAIINGDKKTGITIMYMNAKMDEGDIISSKEVEISNEDTLDTLSKKLSYLGRDLLLETLPSIINGTNNRIKQDENLVTYGLNIKKEEEKINFNKKAVEINNLIRGLNSNPGAYCMLDNKRLKIYQIMILEEISNQKPGYISEVRNNGLVVNTLDNKILITDLKLEGKNRVDGKTFVNGIKKDKIIGKVLE